MNFSDNLRNLRKEKDYSQEYLAEVMKVSRQTVSKWENGSAMPDLKKLTELAEFFNTNMDTLLGIDGAENVPQAESIPRDMDFTPYMEHTERLFTALSESQKQAVEKKYKTSITVLSVCLVILALIMIINTVNMTSNINSLRTQMETLSSSQQVIIQHQDDEDDASYYVNNTLLSRNDEKPWLVTARFSYAPPSYANDTEVSFDVIYSDNSIQNVPMTLQNGVFLAEAEVDLLTAQTCYINVNDGSKTARSECGLDLIWQYVAVSGFPSMTFTEQSTGKQYHYAFTVLDDEYGEPPRAYFSDAVCGKIEKAAMVVEIDGEVTYRKELTMKENHTGYNDMDNWYAEIPSFSFDTDKDAETLETYLELTDSLGVRYRYFSADCYYGTEALDTNSAIVFPSDGFGHTEVIVYG